jgi:hypothetical protein
MKRFPARLQRLPSIAVTTAPCTSPSQSPVNHNCGCAERCLNDALRSTIEQVSRSAKLGGVAFLEIDAEGFVFLRSPRPSLRITSLLTQERKVLVVSMGLMVNPNHEHITFSFLLTRPLALALGLGLTRRLPVGCRIREL